MAFSKAIPRNPTNIPRINIGIYFIAATTDEPEQRGITYRVVLLDQDGAEMRAPGDIGDLLPHLSASDIQWLNNFLTRMVTKAKAEFLG